MTAPFNTPFADKNLQRVYDQGREDERKENPCPECATCTECGENRKHWNSEYCRDCTRKRGNDGSLFFEVDIDKVCEFFLGDRVKTMMFLEKVERER